MRVSSGGYGAVGERQFSQESLARLANDDLFDFQITHSAISVRVLELQELLQRGRDEPDLADLLDEFVHELEDQIHDAGGNELFLLAALQHFRQQMELFLELDQETRMAESGVTKNMFAVASTKKNTVNAASPKHKKAVTATASATATRSPGRVKPQHQQRPQNQQPVVATAAASGEEEIVCGVCLQADSLEHDPIVICDNCNVAVHQSCYRIEELPDEDWFCRPCQRYMEAKDVGRNVTPTYELDCVACKAKGGAFIATVDEDKWVHMACSMFLPELFVQASHRHSGEEVIGGIDQLSERRTLRCTYCKKKNRGACAQCVVGKCTTSYHVMCALKHHIKFVFMEDKGQFGSGCSRHQKQFCDVENQPPTPVTATDKDAKASRPRVKPPMPTLGTKPAATAPVSSLPHKSTGMKAKKKLPRGRASVTSDSSEEDDEDGILLDEESDNSSMFSSDVDSDIGSPPRKSASPARPRAAAASSQPLPRTSPAKLKSPGRGPGRPPKKQQTLMVPSFGIVKQLTKPTVSISPAPAPVAALSAPQARAAPVVKPVSLVPALPPQVSPSPSARVHTKTQIFIPFGGSVVTSGAFEDVLVIIPSMPLGLSIRTEGRPHGKSMLIQGHSSQTHNLVVVDALRRGILQDGDEMLAINDVTLRNREANTLKDVVATLQPPYRIWMRLKSKRSLSKFGIAAPTAAAAAPFVSPTKPPTPVTKPIVSALQQQDASKEADSKDAGEEVKPTAITEKPSSDRTPMEEALSVDWPWHYLRSDGKLAMNSMWKSLDAGFFVAKFDPATWTSLLGKVEGHLGFRLSKSHPEYAEKTEDLLYFPSREHPVPQAIKDYRGHLKKKKQRHLGTDSVFMGVNLEQVSQEDEWDDLPALAVGTTVQVAKRTWPGINKLGGAGRVRKVHEDKSEDGLKTRFLYDISYILGGSEKKVQRKWIAVVGDISNEAKETPTKQPAPESQKTEEKDQSEAENESVKLRLGLRVEVSDKDADLPKVTRSTERKVHLQVSILTNSVALERDQPVDNEASAPAREMLWHLHFPIKQTGPEALLSESLAGRLEYFEELGDDADEEDSDDEESEITKQLLEAQAHFKAVMVRNDALFDALKTAVDAEYATKQYRKRKLDEIQATHYNQMYRDMAAARREFDDDDDSDDDSDDNGGRGGQPSGRTRESDDSDSESDQDDSCGGMFINKIKQEGNEVCVLCELTGGDFAATSCSRVVHPQCAMYTPETFFKDGLAHGLDKIPADERRALTCSICSGKKGLSKIQCANQRCLTAYHVACAYVNGFLTRDPHYQAWCPKHLKTSGMQGEIEWPPHMKPKVQQPTNSKNDTPKETKSPRRGAMSSSKTNSNRKRRRSSTADSTTSDAPASGRKKQPKSKQPKASVVMDVDADDEDAVADRNLARRLDIDVDSDEDDQPDLSVVFSKGDTVKVQAREWPGVNKPGGVARVTLVTETDDAQGGRVVLYDVAYVLTNAKEKQVEAKYVRVYNSDSEANATQQKKRIRAAAVV